MPVIRVAHRSPGFQELLAVLLLATPAGAHAAWEIVPEVSVSAETNDNILLESTNEQTGSRAALDAAVRFSSFGQRGNAYIRPRATTDQYSDPDTQSFESDDFFFEAGADYDWRLVGIGFRSEYSDELVLHSEITDAAPDDPDLDPDDGFPDPDTGRLTSYTERQERLDVRGNVDFRISERNVLRIEGGRQDVAYTGAIDPQSGRSDIETNAVRMAILRRVDERNSLSARMTASEYHAERNDNTTDSVRIEGTFTRPLAPTWSMTLTAGVQRSEYDFLNTNQVRISNAATTEVFSLGFRKRSERTSWNVDMGHRVQPNANGFLAVRDEVHLYATRQFGPRLTGEFGVRAYQSATLDDVNTTDDRDFSRLELMFEWALKPALFIHFGAGRYTQQFVNETTIEATANSIFTGITYRGRSRQDQ